MSLAYEFDVPGDPYSALSPNLRLHRMARARATKAWRQKVNAYWFAMNKPSAKDKVRVTFTLYRTNRGPEPDTDNVTAAMKAVRDGLTGERSLVPDDSGRWWEDGGCAVIRGSEYAQRPFLRIRIEEIE